MYYLTHSELLKRVSDNLDQDLETARKSFSEKRSGRAVRIAHSIANEISREHEFRHELWTIPGDGSTDFWRFDVPYHEIRDVLWNTIPMRQVSYHTHLLSVSRTIVPAVAFGYYYYVNDNGIGVGADLGSSDKLEVSTNAWLPTLRETPVDLTQADWTNDSTTVDNVAETLTEGSNIDVGNAVKAPNGDIYRVASITSASAFELSERYTGATVTGVSGAAEVGGHLCLDAPWHNAVVFGVTHRLAEIEEKFDLADRFERRYLNAIDDGVDVSISQHGVHFSRG